MLQFARPTVSSSAQVSPRLDPSVGALVALGYWTDVARVTTLVYPVT